MEKKKPGNKGQRMPTWEGLQFLRANHAEIWGGRGKIEGRAKARGCGIEASLARPQSIGSVMAE